ncbi:P-loop NTPase fold protein [Phycisphaeraceae bacterium D3-23]
MASRQPDDHDSTPSLKELLARIRELPPDSARVIAGRCAWRVMPLTAATQSEEEAPFSFWGEDAAWYIRGLGIGCVLNLSRTFRGSYDRDALFSLSRDALVTISDTSDIDKTAISAAVHAAVYAGYADDIDAAFAADASSAESASAVDANAVCSTAASAAASASANTAFVLALRDDLEAIQSAIEVPESVVELRLWQGQESYLSTDWHRQEKRWRDSLSRLKRHDIVQCYDLLCLGKGIDGPAVQQRIEAWFADYQAREKEKRAAEEDPGKQPPTTELGKQIDSTSSGSGDKGPPYDPPPVPGLGTGMADRPTGVDSLGRASLVDMLARMFTHREQATPMTMALLGEWGSGKSSVLEQLRCHILDEKLNGKQGRVPCVVADFNAWEHEQCEDIQAGLAQAVITGLTGKNCFCRGWYGFRFACRERYWEVLKLLAALALLVVGVYVASTIAADTSSDFWQSVAGTGVGAGVIAFVIYIWKHGLPLIEAPVWREMYSYMKLPDYRQRLGQVPVMKRQLRTLGLLREIGPDPSVPLDKNPPDRNRLILFIDDLDRCAPETIVQMLDAVRLVMDAPGIIVVLAIDPGVLMEAVTSKEAYGDRGRDYLSKIIQLPIHLGDPHAEDLAGFAKRLLHVEGAADVPQRVRGQESGTTQPPSDDTDVPGGRRTPGNGGDTVGTPSIDLKPIRTSTKMVKTRVRVRSLRARTKPRAQRKRLVELAMSHDKDERDLFAALVTALSINNPRRLIRLRNTYRLMKLMWFDYLPHESEEDYQPLNVLQVLLLADALSEKPFDSWGTEVLSLLEQPGPVELPDDDVQSQWAELHAGVNLRCNRLGVPLLEIGSPDTAAMFQLARSLLLPHPEMDPGPKTSEDVVGEAAGEDAP